MASQPGAAAAVIQSFRGGKWPITPAVAANRSQDLVHRVVGKPGVILVSEGPANRVVPMLATERKRTAVDIQPIHGNLADHLL